MTPQELFEQRRSFMKLGAGALVSASVISELLAKSDKKLELTDENHVYNYVNFYEFAGDKSSPVRLSQSMQTSPWEISIKDGEQEQTFELSELLKNFQIEEQVFRFRCVEGWSMIVPWLGFPLYKLIDFINPTSEPKFVKFYTKEDTQIFPNTKNKLFSGIEHPYIEGLRLDEALNPLAFVAIGMYGKPLKPQNGAPIRLVLPWKYGFKSIKSIGKIEFVKEQFQTTWEKFDPKEYGFYANVNPKVAHPRWSQASERLLGKIFKEPTAMFNGYEKEVGYMYKDMDLVKNF